VFSREASFPTRKPGGSLVEPPGTWRWVGAVGTGGRDCGPPRRAGTDTRWSHTGKTGVNPAGPWKLAVSWLPVTNSTDARRTRITARGGVTLREEMRSMVPDRGTNTVTWETARKRWERYIKSTRDTSLRFDEIEGDGVLYRDRQHRWSPDYQEQRYAKLKDMERGIDRFYNNLWTGMITLTASSEQVSAPVDHLTELTDGRSAALEALRRSLDGRTWDYWWVLEPHESGYLHLHVAVVVEGAITTDQLRPAVEAHLRNCSPAGREAHESAVEVRRGREIGNVAAYLNAYLGDYASDPLDAPEHVRAANAITWATGKRETGASRRLRAFMSGGLSDGGGPAEWQLTAICDDEGEHPVDPEVPGGVDTFETVVKWSNPPPGDDKTRQTGVGRNAY